MKHIRQICNGECEQPYGCNICNLFVCSVCKTYEGGLATECPGVPVTAEQVDRTYNGEIDFINGEWITLPKKETVDEGITSR
jgi:hypothetical protein